MEKLKYLWSCAIKMRRLVISFVMWENVKAIYNSLPEYLCDIFLYYKINSKWRRLPVPLGI